MIQKIKHTITSWFWVISYSKIEKCIHYRKEKPFEHAKLPDNETIKTFLEITLLIIIRILYKNLKRIVELKRYILENLRRINHTTCLKKLLPSGFKLFSKKMRRKIIYESACIIDAHTAIIISIFFSDVIKKLWILTKYNLDRLLYLLVKM
jgi:hypothetical protein